MWERWRKLRATLSVAGILSGLSLTAGLLGTALPARAQDVGLFLYILNPPNAVTDLVASPVGSQDGDVQLVWTAPANANTARIDHYLIRYATFPAANIGSAETWWTQNAGTESTFGPAQQPGVQEFHSIGGLTLDVTYYFGIKSIDVDNQTSPIDTLVGTVNQASSLPLDTGLNATPPPPTNFVGMALSSTSIQWTWDSSLGATNYVLLNDPSGTIVQQTSALFITETGFTPNFALSRRLRAENSVGASAPTSAQTVYTLANTPINPSIQSAGAASITLGWDANANPSITNYRVTRSLNGVNFSVIATVATTTYQDTGLSANTSYYYRVQALNDDDIPTSFTSIVSTLTLRGTRKTPNPPMGLFGFLDPTGKAFTLSWESVLWSDDGSPVENLAGYNVYRRAALNTSPVKLTPVPIPVTVFADQVDNKTFYYTITAVNADGDESAESFYADSSADANIIFVASDNLSSVFMPQSVNELMRSGYNKYGVPLSIAFVEEPIASNTDIVRNIRLQLIRGDNKKALNDLAFAKPQTVVAVGYNLVNGQVAKGAPLAQGVSASATNISPDQLSMYWHNGVTWVKIGGTLDVASQSVKTKSSYLGNYQLRVAARAVSLTLEQGNVYPRVFTPNDDGLNDRVYFVLENPNNSNVRGEIFDLSGRRVATLPPPAATGIGTTIIWDGKDSNGSVVPSGVYMYRLEGEGKTFTGTVAVAR